jgi:hypothetical protein
MPISLPNAVAGQVVTRFPPEPSWLLDLGHCKASLMNQHIATQFQVSAAQQIAPILLCKRPPMRPLSIAVNPVSQEWWGYQQQ